MVRWIPFEEQGLQLNVTLRAELQCAAPRVSRLSCSTLMQRIKNSELSHKDAEEFNYLICTQSQVPMSSSNVLQKKHKYCSLLRKIHVESCSVRHEIPLLVSAGVSSAMFALETSVVSSRKRPCVPVTEMKESEMQ